MEHTPKKTLPFWRLCVIALPILISGLVSCGDDEDDNGNSRAGEAPLWTELSTSISCDGDDDSCRSGTLTLQSDGQITDGDGASLTNNELDEITILANDVVNAGVENDNGCFDEDSVDESQSVSITLPDGTTSMVFQALPGADQICTSGSRGTAEDLADEMEDLAEKYLPGPSPSPTASPTPSPTFTTLGE